MSSRRRGRAVMRVLALTALGAVAVPVTISGALPSSGVNENGVTLNLSLPGPFNGCSFLSARATPTTDALLDLTQPSAFVTNANGTLVGEGEAISSAELTSLSPETVRYTIGANEVWSDDTPFTGLDLVRWWQRAKTLASVTSDGYRAIKSLTLSTNHSVTAVFANPYADWDLLFRDMNEPTAPLTCSIANLQKRASLGPYEVVSATANRVVLVMNSTWTNDPNRFGRIVVTDTQKYPSRASEAYADYTLAVSPSALVALSNHPTLNTRIGSSSNIEELTFSPHSALGSQLFMRQALSWSIERQTLIDKEFGAVTFSPSVAASAIYSQGQNQYPGGGGTNPVGQTTTTATTPAPGGFADCPSCAATILKQNGYVKSTKGWLSYAGAALVVRLVIGPSDLDESVAQVVTNDWASIGVKSRVEVEPSEAAAARAAAAGSADVALFARPTTTTPAYAARSWAGPAYPDSYPSGVRIPEATTLFEEASTIFNPVTASTTWLKLDQLVMTDYWVRPLFTAPSLVVWASALAPLQSSFTLSGFVDQVPAWSMTPSTIPS